MPHTYRSVITPCAILMARGGHYNARKRPIVYSPDVEGGGAYVRVAHFVTRAVVRNNWSFFSSHSFLFPEP